MVWMLVVHISVTLVLHPLSTSLTLLFSGLIKGLKRISDFQGLQHIYSLSIVEINYKLLVVSKQSTS